MMPILTDYNQFGGRHWETSSVQHVLAYQGVKAPHTGQPFSEALLLGASGGIVFGYFLFAYEGYDPHLALLTRNTFDPMQTMLEHLGIVQDIAQTSTAAQGEQNLIDALENGQPAIVWADWFSLPYNALPYDENNWGIFPLVVYGYEDGVAYLADRADVSLQVSADDLMKARARVKKERFRVMTLDMPGVDKVIQAVHRGIWETISLYTEKPPMGRAENFGLLAYQEWATMLTNTRNKRGWSRFFPPGRELFAALAGRPWQPGAFTWVRSADGDGAERGLYADFLDEAAIILEKPEIKDVAAQFREARDAWITLSEALLPDDIPLLKEMKALLLERGWLFKTEGAAALDRIRSIDTRWEEIREAVSADFPMSESELVAFRENLAEHVLTIHDIEYEAITDLQSMIF